MMYAGLIGLVHALSYYRLFRDREVRNSQLETRLARSQLQVLRAQLQPHFLFNTLNSIAALMHRDVESADRMVTRLGDLLRLSLSHTERQEVPLRQELAFLEKYLDIQRTRFRDRLTARVSADADALDGLVPSLILQPLVENAIRHGIEPRAAAGRVDVRARLDGDALVVEVEDDGPGLSPDARGEPNGCGIGLANTRARLEQLYGDRQRLTLSNGPGGLLVRVELPYRVGQLPTPVHLHA
jgi:LytS/YehU family sensor histidine kinase